MAATWASIVINDSTGDESFGEMFGVDSVERVDVSAHCRTTRAVKALRTSGLTESVALLEQGLDDLRSISSCGPRTILDIVQALLLTIACSPFTSTEPATGGAGSLFEIQPAQDTCDGPEGGRGSDVFPALERFAAGLDGRELAVLRHRIILADRKLSEFTKTHNVTGERIRQIESELRLRLAAWRRSATACPALAALEREVKGAVRVLIDRHRLREALPVLEQVVSHLSLPLADLLPILLTDVHFTPRWVSLRPLADLREEVRQKFAIDRMTGGENPEAVRRSLSLTEGEWVDWLAFCALEQMADGTITPVDATMAERAGIVLRRAGGPMTAEQLAERIGSASSRNMRGYLQADSRIARLGPQLYGLAEWNLETYEGIKEEIVQRITRAGGRALLNDLIEELVVQFRVERGSVRAYTYGREFVRQGPWLMLNSKPGGKRARAKADVPGPESTRRTFYRGGTWWHRVDVKPDMLRGSGFPVPIGVAALFGVLEGAERVMQSPAGPLRLSWTRTQPTMGSVRAILLSARAEVGHALWVAPGSGSDVLTRLAGPAQKTARSRLAHLCGIDENLNDDALARAVSMAVGRDIALEWSDLASVLRARGDSDVVKEIEGLAGLDTEQPTDVDDFLRALRGR